MLLTILEVVLLLSAIVISLRPPKTKKKHVFNTPLKVCKDTEVGSYAVNERGALEEIQKASLTDHQH
ncbi:MAG: hypothetical protein JWR50_1558 [Mucilaginibacter sp.]|jgi:hypothetical protein|nr:hypothetical protein [Mucilaginibacter sp.]